MIRSEVEDFKKFVPIVQALRNPGMRERHWEQISRDLGMVRPDLRQDGDFFKKWFSWIFYCLYSLWTQSGIFNASFFFEFVPA